MNFLLRRFPPQPVLTILEKEVRRLQDAYSFFHDGSRRDAVRLLTATTDFEQHDLDFVMSINFIFIFFNNYCQFTCNSICVRLIQAVNYIY